MASPSLVTSAVAQSDQEAVEIAAFRLPRYSDFLSAETRSGIERMETVYADAFKRCDPRTKPAGAELVACEKLFYPPIVEVARNAFAVDISEHRIGGVRTDIVTPADGTSKANATRVLINVHGGAFKYGARFSGPLDSMAVAAIGKYKVVAVDYRLGADVRFPSASVEVASVYRELLRTHRPEDIGFFGCSGGARQSKQFLGFFYKEIDA